jgi:hypothetical protein
MAFYHSLAKLKHMYLGSRNAVWIVRYLLLQFDLLSPHLHHCIGGIGAFGEYEQRECRVF